jgi:hypothetical protein
VRSEHLKGTKQQRKENLAAAQAQTIDELVTSASGLPWPPRSRTETAEFWQSMSSSLEKVFDLSNHHNAFRSHALEYFLDLYFEHFGPLWPLLSPQNLEYNFIHPLLYLTLTSIGSMYGAVSQTSYGSMMHNRVRKSLTAALELEDSDDDFVWLGQARLLTQVAALYFGSAKGFSYAQHLGGLLVAQARRMNLFSIGFMKSAASSWNGSETPHSNAERLARWLSLEARRRLAFGILRADMYTSILLNIRPLVSVEEFDLELPGSDAVWRSDQMPAHVSLQIIEQDKTLGRHLRFSDIYRIALDQNEPLPALEPSGNELLLFGLQQPVWQYSRDPKMFQRLTGNEIVYSRHEAVGSPVCERRVFGFGHTENNFVASRNDRRITGHEVDHLESPLRQMVDLKRGFDRITCALHKWKQSLTLVRTLVNSDKDRNSLLSSLILYHLSYLRLHAPIGDLHQIPYQLADRRPIENVLIESVSQWANTNHAQLAVQHASSIWSLIAKECMRPESIRAKFNLIAFTGLHHSAVVLWSYAGAHDFSQDRIGDPPLVLDYSGNAQPEIPIRRDTTHQLLRSFIRLYGLISPGRWLSFATAAMKLLDHQFPKVGSGLNKNSSTA